MIYLKNEEMYIQIAKYYSKPFESRYVDIVESFIKDILKRRALWTTIVQRMSAPLMITVIVDFDSVLSRYVLELLKFLSSCAPQYQGIPKLTLDIIDARRGSITIKSLDLSLNYTPLIIINNVVFVGIPLGYLFYVLICSILAFSSGWFSDIFNKLSLVKIPRDLREVKLYVLPFCPYSLYMSLNIIAIAYFSHLYYRRRTKFYIVNVLEYNDRNLKELNYVPLLVVNGKVINNIVPDSKLISQFIAVSRKIRILHT